MESRVGERFITNENCGGTIVGYNNSMDCALLFDNGYVINSIPYGRVQKGNIKNPYRPIVCGVGYLGVGKYKAYIECKPTKIYQVWSNMLVRCYSKKQQEKQPTYKDCSVDERWHNFQVFGEWFEEFYKEGFALDKDILVKGNKIYSYGTCCFVPKQINILFIKANKIRGEYPIGVHKKGNKFIAQIGINGKFTNLGSFDTPEEAFEAYKIAKEAYIREVAEFWKDQITEQCYQALINYKVEIDD